MNFPKVPLLEKDDFLLIDIPKLFEKGKIKINKEYQRGDIWKPKAKVELVKSILSGYSIGVLVLFINEDEQYEILDGQQRLHAIQQYLEGSLNIKGSDLKPYASLDDTIRRRIDTYSVYYLKLTNRENKEEEIVQTFLRLQEGTPLNKAEKLNAFRGKFRDVYLNARETHPVFKYLPEDKRFRWRQLAAEMLLIELEGDFENKIFPNLDFESMRQAAEKYKDSIASKQSRNFIGNLDIIERSLSSHLQGFDSREMIATYLLISYLRKQKAGNFDLPHEFFEFISEFLRNLNCFSMYQQEPPEGMEEKIFKQYKEFKQQSKAQTTKESLKKRLEFLVQEYQRIYPFINKDPKRFHDAEQKRTLFFRQKGSCPACGKKLVLAVASAHHVIPHSKGGQTDNLDEAVLLHPKCHERLEKRLLRSNLTENLPFVLNT